MAQQVFTQGNRVAAAQSGSAVTTSTSLANYVIWNKSNGYVEGVVTGGTGTYTVRPQAISTQWNNRVEVENNGTTNIVISYKLAPGEGTGFVLSSSAAGTLTMSGANMRHTAVGTSDDEFDQVFLGAVS